MTESNEQPSAERTDLDPTPVTPEPAEPGETPMPDEAAVDSPAPVDAAIQESEAEVTGQAPDPEAVAAASEPARSRPAGNGGKLTRVTLGSALLAVDTVNERLDQLDETAIETQTYRRSRDDVLVPMSDWEERFGVSADRPARHLMLGMMIDARSRAGAAARFLGGVGDSLAGAINFVLRPVRTRRVFRPVRRGFDKAAGRGDSQVQRWMAMGRAEEIRSRALAETALSSAAADTMDELVANDRVEIFVQEMLEAQTMGIVDEIIEELRERAVSSDNFFERPVHRLFRRPDRSELPGPDFSPRVVLPFARRNQLISQDSLLGQYAGFVSRLLALIVDVGLIVIVLALGSSLLTTAVDVLGLREWLDSFMSSTDLFTSLFAIINGLVIVIGYLVLFWMLTGQTLGMMLLGLRVVTLSGGRVTFWQAILRIIGYILLPVIFFLGFLWILGDDKRRAWHDMLARTCVVYTWDARPDETFLTYGMYMD